MSWKVVREGLVEKVEPVISGIWKFWYIKSKNILFVMSEAYLDATEKYY